MPGVADPAAAVEAGVANHLAVLHGVKARIGREPRRLVPAGDLLGSRRLELRQRACPGVVDPGLRDLVARLEVADGHDRRSSENVLALPCTIPGTSGR